MIGVFLNEDLFKAITVKFFIFIWEKITLNQIDSNITLINIFIYEKIFSFW